MTLPQIVAHRGSAADRPENALSSFIAAVEEGADQIELDVHLTADNELVVIHDATLDDTSHGYGPVAARTLAELRQIRLRGVDETIPTLGEVLDAVGSRTHTRIEIKQNADKQDYQGLVPRIMEAVASRNLKERVTIMCFQLGSLQPFAKAGYQTSLSLAWDLGAHKDLSSLVRELADNGISDIGYIFAEVTPERIETITSGGLTIGVWTVNGPSRLDHWVRQPVSYILTDQAALALKLRGGR
jgi:glycerophosphoryl diester phosphodiesterase